MQDEQQPQAGWVFTPGQQAPVTPAPQQPAPPAQPAHQAAPSSDGHISWTASEYVAHQKGANWFVTLGLGATVLATVIFFLTKDKLSPIVVIVVAIIFGSFAARKPQVLEYVVDEHGIKIGPKTYAYSAFKAFSINDDSAIRSINFLPVKRFMPGLTIHFEEKDEDKIAEAIGSYLPLEEHKPEFIERFMDKLRF